MNFLSAQVLTVFFYTINVGLTTDASVYNNELQEIKHLKKPIIPILKHSFEQHKDGYRYSYETGNGIKAQESGYFKHRGDEKHETLVQQGSVTYLDEHGNPITLTYIADENGFQPQGSHLPTPPTIPEGYQQNHLKEQEEEQEVEYEQEQPVEYEQQPQSYEGQQQY